MDNNESQLEVSEQFGCSKEELFKAWTEESRLKQWWKPLGNQLERVKNDIREGGLIEYNFVGDKLKIDGKYEKAQQNRLLEYSWNWHLPSEQVEDWAYKLSVRFDGNGNSSTLSITQSGFSNDQNVIPHKQGWEQALQQLQEFVSKERDAAIDDGAQKPPISGYNETPEQQKVAGG